MSEDVDGLRLGKLPGVAWVETQRVPSDEAISLS